MANNRMTFTLVGRDELSQALRRAGGSAGRLKKDLAALGSTAALPAAAAGVAALTGIAQAAAAAGVAIGVFGAAVAPQAAQIGKISDAQTKYQEAVAESGARSEEAAKAQMALARASAALPPATRESAAAFLVLKDAYTDWSNSLAGDTTPVLTHSFEALSTILPKLSPLVRGTGDELDRMVTILAGGMQTKGFDRVIAEFTDFANGSLQQMNNGLVHLMRVSSGLDMSPVSDFLAQAQQYGPLAADTLKNVGEAALKLLSAGGDLGVVMLHVADALANVVNAIPSSTLGVILQLYAAFRLISLAGAAWAALAPRMMAMGRALSAMSVAATAAGGGMVGLRAAFAAMSTTAKVSVVIAGIAAVVLVLSKLSNIGKEAPPDVDKLSASLKQLGRSGKIAGEAARVFGTDLNGLADALSTLERPSNLDKTQQFLTKLIGMDSTPVKEAKEKFDGLDESLANLVKGGKADIAAAALDRLISKMKSEGKNTAGVKKHLEDYKSALADMKLEQKLAADGMGLFGQQAQKTQEKLAAQKASADGLRQSIQALNDVQRAGLGGMIGFEAAIDNATKAAKDNAGALDMVHGQLDLNSEKAQNAATALNDLAAKTDEAAGSARESGASWSAVNGIYERGRAQLVKVAQQMGLTKTEANSLAAQILKVPNKKVIFKGNLDDLKAKINKATKDIHNAPASKLTRLQGNIKDLEDKLSAAKRGIKNVPASKRSSIRGEISDLQDKIARAKRELASLHNKTITVTTFFRTIRSSGGSNQAAKNAYETMRAHGGPVPGYASGGSVQALQSGGYVRGPGSSTSDSVRGLFSGGVANVSDREYVIQAQAVRKYGIATFDALNAMQVPRAPRSATTATATPASNTTINVYPQRADFTVHDLEALQRRSDIRARVGRAR
jgi:hypothetical protein